MATTVTGKKTFLMIAKMIATTKMAIKAKRMVPFVPLKTESDVFCVSTLAESDGRN